MAQARADGDVHYEPDNWKHGDVCFFIDCLDHAIEHLYKAVPAATVEEIERHLGHAACNIAFLLHALHQGILRPGDLTAAAVLCANSRRP